MLEANRRAPCRHYPHCHINPLWILLKSTSDLRSLAVTRSPLNFPIETAARSRRCERSEAIQTILDTAGLLRRCAPRKDAVSWARHSKWGIPVWGVSIQPAACIFPVINRQISESSEASLVQRVYVSPKTGATAPALRRRSGRREKRIERRGPRGACLIRPQRRRIALASRSRCDLLAASEQRR